MYSWYKIFLFKIYSALGINSPDTKFIKINMQISPEDKLILSSIKIHPTKAELDQLNSLIPFIQDWERSGRTNYQPACRRQVFNYKWKQSGHPAKRKNQEPRLAKRENRPACRRQVKQINK